jgi:hypothetical protein
MKTPILLLFGVLFYSFIHAQNRYDVVIDEVMADPSPQIGLPNSEWLELKNSTGSPINLQNWRIGDASGQSGPMPSFILEPDSFVIICAASALNSLSAFGRAISVTSFPSFDNDGDMVFLKAPSGKTIHAINYASTWYGNEIKKEGGWSLEMIDTNNPCAGKDNWKATTHITGGTPGKKNSIDAINPVTNAPGLKKAYATANNTIILVFDKPIDSLRGATISNYSIDGGLSIINAITLAPLFNSVELKINTVLAENTIYSITSANITDCRNNIVSELNKIKTGLPKDPAIGDWIINEILFNPRPNGYDYVEFYNNSHSIFDASKLYIANRNSTGVINSARLISPEPYYVFPGDYIVLTEDADNLSLNYLVQNPDNVLMLSLPSFPDDKGSVVALNFQGEIVDEVQYNDDWHFKLITDPEAVALERIDPSSISQEKTNWHSAASTAGYGTPGYKNSQYKPATLVNGAIEVLPTVFSPDNDGFADIASIHYKMPGPGFAANITIFDATGRPVRNLVRNNLLAPGGYWNWDGLDDKGNKLAIGVYVIFSELFNLQGKKYQFKNTIVLARKLP